MNVSEIKMLAFIDSATLTTGFARVGQNLFRRWHAMGVQIDCWGIGFSGWGYRSVPYIHELFPGGGPGEWCSVPNLQLFLKQLKRGGYTHVFILQDTFTLSRASFPSALRELCSREKIHSTYYFPVDAPLDPGWTLLCNAVDVAVAYTEFGKAEAEKQAAVLRARAKKHKMPRELKCHVIPHGVDTAIYRPLPDRAEIRKMFWEQEWVKPEDFVLLNVNMNQRRKDVARSLEILAELKRRGLPAKLIMHMPESTADGVSLCTVAEQLGLEVDRDWGHHGALFRGVIGVMPEEKLAELYNVADLYLTTSLGEGWGLGITEALGCGCPVAMPWHTSCREIGEHFLQAGLYEQIVALPLEKGALVQPQDNSRLRWRTDLMGAAEAIEHWHNEKTRNAERGTRNALTPALEEWLSWDRIANEFLRLMGNGKGNTPIPQYPNTQTPQTSVISAEGECPAEEQETETKTLEVIV